MQKVETAKSVSEPLGTTSYFTFNIASVFRALPWLLPVDVACRSLTHMSAG